MKFLIPILLLLFPIVAQAQLPCKFQTYEYYQLYHDGTIERHVRATPVVLSYNLTEVDIDFGLSRVHLKCPCELVDGPLELQKMVHGDWVIYYQTTDLCGWLGVALGNSIQLYFSDMSYPVEYIAKQF